MIKTNRKGSKIYLYNMGQDNSTGSEDDQPQHHLDWAVECGDHQQTATIKVLYYHHALTDVAMWC